MTVLNSRTLCKPLFQRLELLNLSSQYILSLMRFLSQNLELYTFNSTIHGFNTRNKLQLQKLSTTQQHTSNEHTMSIKIFNKLPHYIAELVLSNLKWYLNDKVLYSIEEYRNSSTFYMIRGLIGVFQIFNN